MDTNGTHQVFNYADYVNLIRDNIRTIAGVLLNVGSAVNARKAKYMALGRHHGMMASEQIRIGSNSYEKVMTFKC